MPLFFNADHLPEPSLEYVAWVDVMGTQASMSRSLRVTANFMFKLHLAALQAPQANVRIYPVMDGFYAAAGDRVQMLNFLRGVFSAVAEEFNTTNENRFRFIVRGGLAFGPSVHGTNVPAGASPVLGQAPNYRDSILLGMPMVQAHLSEADAPPYGILVHESARTFAPLGQEPLHHIWWRWDNAANHAVWSALQDNLNVYFDWCAERSLRLGYSLDRIKAHKNMVAQYFTDMQT